MPASSITVINISTLKFKIFMFMIKIFKNKRLLLFIKKSNNNILRKISNFSYQGSFASITSLLTILYNKLLAFTLITLASLGKFDLKIFF